MKSEFDLDHHLPHQNFSGDYSKNFVPMNKNSQIGKIKPKICIIHIFEPEIINTDVKDFRKLVQSLTGKPEITKTDSKKNKTKTNFTLPPQPLPQETGQEHATEYVNAVIESPVVKEEWGTCSNTNTYFNLDDLIDFDYDDMFSSRWFDLQEQYDYATCLN